MTDDQNVEPPAETLAAPDPRPAPATRKPAAYAAVIVGLLAMIGGAIFFVRSVGSVKGASTPEAAVTKMLEAVSNEDVLGVLETMPSAERNLFSARLQTLTKELGRLGILRPNLNLSDLPGIDLEFSGIELQSENLTRDLASVTITKGHSTYRVDTALSPLGDFVRKLLPRSTPSSLRGSDDLADDKVALATVREDGNWYVSIFYTMGEQARRAASRRAPVESERLKPRGAASPEEAAKELIRSAFDLDVRRIIQLMPPDEAAALYYYAPLFIDDAAAAARDARELFRAHLRELVVSSRASGDDRLVTITKITFRIEVPDESISVDYDGKCVTLSGEFFGFDRPERKCDLGAVGAVPVPLPELPEAGFIVVHRGGAWYVSPVRTILDTMIQFFRTLKPDDLENFRQGLPPFFLGGGFEEPSPTSVETLLPRT